MQSSSVSACAPWLWLQPSWSRRPCSPTQGDGRRSGSHGRPAAGTPTAHPSTAPGRWVRSSPRGARPTPARPACRGQPGGRPADHRHPLHRRRRQGLHLRPGLPRRGRALRLMDGRSGPTARPPGSARGHPGSTSPFWWWPRVGGRAGSGQIQSVTGANRLGHGTLPGHPGDGAGLRRGPGRPAPHLHRPGLLPRGSIRPSTATPTWTAPAAHRGSGAVRRLGGGRGHRRPPPGRLRAVDLLQRAVRLRPPCAPTRRRPGATGPRVPGAGERRLHHRALSGRATATGASPTPIGRHCLVFFPPAGTGPGCGS